MTEKKEVVEEKKKINSVWYYAATAAVSALAGGFAVFNGIPNTLSVEMKDVNNDNKADIVVTYFNREKVYFANDEGGKREYLSIGELTNRYEKSLQTLESKIQ